VATVYLQLLQLINYNTRAGTLIVATVYLQLIQNNKLYYAGWNCNSGKCLFTAVTINKL